MNVLVVFAHPELQSFNGALKDTAVQTLAQQGHNVVVSDLYRLGWRTVLDEPDFPAHQDHRFLDVSAEQELAFRDGTQSADVVAEQAKVAAADFVLFVFPMWWFSMPAILKGWVDRVFGRGFAYSAGRKYSKGHFVGKRAMLCVTTGTASTLYEPAGIDGDLLHVLWPIHNGILAYTGFSVLPPFAAWMPGKVSAEQRHGYLMELGGRLSDIDSTEPLFFHPMSDYDDTQRLKPGVKARSGIQWNTRADQTRQDTAEQYTRRTQ